MEFGAFPRSTGACCLEKARVAPLDAIPETHAQIALLSGQAEEVGILDEGLTIVTALFAHVSDQSSSFNSYTDIAF